MLKGAIVGIGKIAQSNHLPAFFSESLNRKVKIVAGVEPDEMNRHLCMDKYKSIRFYASLNELFREAKVDFIDIASPPNTHHNLLLKAFEYQTNIICEKPLTTNYEEAKAIENIFLDSKVHFMPCHQYKYSPIWKEFKTFIDNTDEDEKVHVKFEVVRMAADYGLETSDDFWRIEKSSSGGGILTDTGLHYIYLSRWMLGNPLAVTCNTFNLRHKSYGVEDTAVALLEFEKGVVEISLTWAGNRRFNSARIVSGKGSLNYDGGRYLYKNLKDSEEKMEVPLVSDKSHYVSLFVDLFNDFIDDVEQKKVNREHFKEAFESIRILNECYKSAIDMKKVVL